MKLFYLKRGKEELKLAMELSNSLNDKTIFRMFNHLTKSMDFMVDYLRGEHTDLGFNIKEMKEIIYKVVGKEFLETYYLLDLLKKKSIRVLNHEAILVEGKQVEQFTKENFNEIIFKVVNYFNTIYDKTENGLIWH